jgi:PST family polysaccharide transporter
MSTESKAASGAAWTIASGLVARALGLVGTFVLLKFVAPGDYGEACAAAVVVQTINQFAMLAVGIYVIAERNITREEVFHATFIHLALGLVAAAALLVLGEPLAPLFDTPQLPRYVPGLSAMALMDRVAYMPERVLVKQLRFRRASLIRSVGELIYAGVSVATAWKGMGGMSIVAGNLARSGFRMVAFVLSVHLADWLMIGRVQAALLKKIAAYGFKLSLNGLANFAAGRWDNLLVSRFFGPAVMGTYNVAYNLAELPAVQVGEQVTDVMQAAFSHMDSAARKRTLLRSVGVLGLVTFPLAIGLALVAPTVSEAFLHGKWVDVGPMLMILSTLSIFRPAYGAVWSFILAERGPNVLVAFGWLTLAGLMVAISTIGRISPLWTCGAVGLVFGVRMLGGMVVAQRLSGVRVVELLARFFPPLVACLPMAAAVYGLRAAMRHLGLHASLLRLIVEVSGGAMVFLGSAFVFAPTSARELWGMLRGRLLRRFSRRSTPSAEAAETAEVGEAAKAGGRN